VNAPAKFFDASVPVAFGGKDAGNTPAFRWYDKDRLVHGRRLEDHLRFAVCYWHSFCWPGGDPFGGETFLRPWHQGADAMAQARAKADVASLNLDRGLFVLETFQRLQQTARGAPG